MFLTEATLRREDVRNDIAAALSLSMALEYRILDHHDNCPFHDTATKSRAGLARLLGRFETQEQEEANDGSE